jgi:hypothetical protein
MATINHAHALDPFVSLSKEETQKVDMCFEENKILKQNIERQQVSPWAPFIEGLLLGFLIIPLSK